MKFLSSDEVESLPMTTLPNPPALQPMPTDWEQKISIESKDKFLPLMPLGYKEKNWAPEKVQMKDVRELAHAYSRMKFDKKHNSLTGDPNFFLANALVENRPGSYGVISYDIPEVVKGVNDYRYGGSDGEDAMRYGLTLLHKTGKYADKIYGKNATKEQKMGLWNGRGKSTKEVKYFGKNGIADVDNHVRKVQNMMRALRDPANAQLLEEWNRYLDPNVWQFRKAK